MSGSSLIKFLKKYFKKMTWPGFSLCAGIFTQFAEQLNVYWFWIYTSILMVFGLEFFQLNLVS